MRPQRTIGTLLSPSPVLPVGRWLFLAWRVRHDAAAKTNAQEHILVRLNPNILIPLVLVLTGLIAAVLYVALGMDK